jgi:hypothetical protein
MVYHLFCNPDRTIATIPESAVTAGECCSSSRPIAANTPIAVHACLCGIIGGMDAQHWKAPEIALTVAELAAAELLSA